MNPNTATPEAAATPNGLLRPAAHRINLLGCPLDAVRRDELLEELVRRVRERQPTTLLFANVAKLVWARRNPELRHALAAADFVLADGQPLIWASHLVGSPLPERIAGIDMMEATLAVAAQNGWRVFFLGTHQAILAQALANVARRYPGLILAGAHHGYFPTEQTERILEAINASRADLLLVALGSPQKELWLARYGPKLAVPIRQTVGGSFEVLAGHRRRAPAWMQRAGLEWLYRLLQDPRHLAPRYLYTNTFFLLLVAAALLRRL
ncbi:MAG: WecB/TagA/CpsF family glycosyltransferase, partial [Terriglobia bacterium]